MYWAGAKGVESQGATEGKLWRFWAQEKWKEIRALYHDCMHSILSPVITVATMITSLIIVAYFIANVYWTEVCRDVSCNKLIVCSFIVSPSWGSDNYILLVVLWIWHRLVQVNNGMACEILFVNSITIIPSVANCLTFVSDWYEFSSQYPNCLDLVSRASPCLSILLRRCAPEIQLHCSF